jgi:hypothetical protein
MRSAPTLKELRHSIGDVLDVASLTAAQMVQALLKKVNGSTTLKQALTAALSMARERQTERIAELERSWKTLRPITLSSRTSCRTCRSRSRRSRQRSQHSKDCIRSHRKRAKMPPSLEGILKNVIRILRRHVDAAVEEIAVAMADEAAARDRVANLREQLERGDEP